MFNDIVKESIRISNLDDKSLSEIHNCADKIFSIFCNSSVCNSLSECDNCPLKTACNSAYILLNSIKAEMFDRSVLNNERKASEKERIADDKNESED